MSALFTALVEGETKESLAAMVCDLRASRAELLAALEDTQRVIEKHGFGGLDQNPFGIRDIIGSAILRARGPNFRVSERRDS